MPSIVSGQVNNNGGIVYGTGFSVTHNSAGSYTISFDNAFNAPPAVSATQMVAQSVHVQCAGLPSITTTSVTLFFQNVSNYECYDTSFTFIAVETAPGES
jgi:hypothetical protein